MLKENGRDEGFPSTYFYNDLPYDLLPHVTYLLATMITPMLRIIGKFSPVCGPHQVKKASQKVSSQLNVQYILMQRNCTGFSLYILLMHINHAMYIT